MQQNYSQPKPQQDVDESERYIMDHDHKWILDWAALGTLLASIADWLPAVATLFTIVWTAIRIYETKSFKAFLYAIKRLLSRR